MSSVVDHGPRLEALDSLRGLAALVVFSSHCVLCLQNLPPALDLVRRTPLSLLLLGGHQAVILFFVLSGFVLYLPYTRPAKIPRQPYASFLAKRLCRIYLPYLGGVVVVATAYAIFFRPQPPHGLTAYFSWRPLTHAQLFSLACDHILFLGSFHREYWNSSTWSLAEEMRIAFIFPVLASALLRLGWRTMLPVALFCSVAVSCGMHLTHHRFPLATLHYAAIFLFGSILCSRRERLLRLWRRLGRAGQSALVFASFVACNDVDRLVTWAPPIFQAELAEWLMALCVAVVLLSALAGTWFSRFLARRHMQHLGRISYSFYLLHIPCLYTLIELLWGRISPFAIFGLALLLTLLLAELFFRAVERPSMALGKHIALRVRDHELGVASRIGQL